MCRPPSPKPSQIDTMNAIAKRHAEMNALHSSESAEPDSDTGCSDDFTPPKDYPLLYHPTVADLLSYLAIDHMRIVQLYGCIGNPHQPDDYVTVEGIIASVERADGSGQVFLVKMSMGTVIERESGKAGKYCKEAVLVHCKDAAK